MGVFFSPIVLSKRWEKTVNGTPVKVPIPKEIPRRNLLAPKSSIYQNKKLSRNPHITPATRNTIKVDDTSTLHKIFRTSLKIFFAGGLKSRFSFKIQRDANNLNEKYKNIMDWYPLEVSPEIIALSCCLMSNPWSAFSATSISNPANGPKMTAPTVPKSFCNP